MYFKNDLSKFDIYSFYIFQYSVFETRLKWLSGCVVICLISWGFDDTVFDRQMDFLQ